MKNLVLLAVALLITVVSGERQRYCKNGAEVDDDCTVDIVSACKLDGNNSNGKLSCVPDGTLCAGRVVGTECSNGSVTGTCEKRSGLGGDGDDILCVIEGPDSTEGAAKEQGKGSDKRATKKK